MKKIILLLIIFSFIFSTASAKIVTVNDEWTKSPYMFSNNKSTIVLAEIGEIKTSDYMEYDFIKFYKQDIYFIKMLLASSGGMAIMPVNAQIKIDGNVFDLKYLLYDTQIGNRLVTQAMYEVDKDIVQKLKSTTSLPVLRVSLKNATPLMINLTETEFNEWRKVVDAL